jgi:N utilization substance protein B
MLKNNYMKRRKGREYVLQFLYSWELIENSNKSNIQEEIIRFWRRNKEEDKNLKTFASEIIKGTLENLNKIDSIIKKYANKWDVERMINIDRNIIRFAVYEILFRPDIPFQVTINEALEIAKKYSTKESASFINGILDKIAKEELKCPPSQKADI